jgi:diguanylate cyclase (GGDEF)-like protein
MADVDQFKLYNDSEGHLAGDECLRLVAQAMRRVLHREGDLLARYGGEEFVLIAPGADFQGVLTLAERMRQAVAAVGLPHPTGTHRIVTISVGAAFGWPGSSPAKPFDLVQMADKAMYRAKLAGRNRVEVDAA